MSCFGRGLRRTAPARGSSRNDLVTPSTASLSRVNGWACPPHSFQLVGWTIYSYMAVVGFGIYIPLLPSPWSHMAYSVTFTQGVKDSGSKAEVEEVSRGPGVKHFQILELHSIYFAWYK
jgi:hypothetical protein